MTAFATLPSPPRIYDYRPGGFKYRPASLKPERRRPRVYTGGAYWPSPGLQWIVLDVFPAGRGWSVEFMERWTGGERARTKVMAYLDFCREARVEP